MNKPNRALASEEELDKFENFLFEMDDVLDQFIAQAHRAGIELDYSLNSLSQLESFIINRGDESDSSFENRAARYLGEVFRKVVGGKWELCLKGPKYLYFKLPVIAGYSNHPIEFCPIMVIGNFKAKRQPGMFKTAVESNLEFKA